MEFDEEILLFTSFDLFQTIDIHNNSVNSENGNKSKSSPFRKLICVTKNDKARMENVSIVGPNIIRYIVVQF